MNKGMPISSGDDCPVCAKGPGGAMKVPLKGAPGQAPKANPMQRPGVAGTPIRPGSPIQLRPGPFSNNF